MGGGKGISYSKPITTWDYIPNGIGKDVFYIGSDGHLYLEVKEGKTKKKVMLPHSGTAENSLTAPPKATWLKTENLSKREQSLRTAFEQKIAILPPQALPMKGAKTEPVPTLYIYADDVNNDGMPDIDTNGYYDNEAAQTGHKIVNAIGDDGKMHAYTVEIQAPIPNTKFNTYQLENFVEGGTLFYFIGGETGQAVVVDRDGGQKWLNPTIANVNGRMIMTITSENIKAPTNGNEKDVKDAIEISWNPLPKWSPTPADGNYLDVKIASYHDGAAIDGQALLQTQGNPVDQDGDGIPDPVISVETTPHPYKNKTQEHPDGLDHSQTTDVRTRVGVAHSAIGMQIE